MSTSYASRAPSPTNSRGEGRIQLICDGNRSFCRANRTTWMVVMRARVSRRRWNTWRVRPLPAYEKSCFQVSECVRARLLECCWRRQSVCEDKWTPHTKLLLAVTEVWFDSNTPFYPTLRCINKQINYGRPTHVWCVRTRRRRVAVQTFRHFGGQFGRQASAKTFALAWHFCLRRFCLWPSRRPDRDARDRWDATCVTQYV